MRGTALVLGLLLSLVTVAMAGAVVVSGDCGLSWDPVTMNVDGQPVTNLLGYRLSAYTQPGRVGQLVGSVEKDTATVTARCSEVGIVTDGTYYLTVVAFKPENIVSAPSNELEVVRDTQAPEAPTNLHITFSGTVNLTIEKQ